MTTVDEARAAHAALADALMALRDKDPDALRLLLDTGSRDYAYAIAQRLVSASGVRTEAAVRAEREGLVALPDWPTLANIIRTVDGKHDLGAGELAERILDALATPPAPVAEP